MKKLFIFTAVFFALTASAQEPYRYQGPFVQKITGDHLNEFYKKLGKDTIPNFADHLSMSLPKMPTAKYLFTQPNGTRVYSLPQDKMPCVVPDLSQFNMPIVGKGIKTNGMPPGSSPQQKLIPDNILPDKKEN